MARNRGMYVDYGGASGRRGRRGPHLGTVCGVLIVVILAVIFGVMAYKVSGKNLDDLPAVPTETPVPGTPTPTPIPTPTPTPTSTPTPTPTNTPTPVPTSPETGLPCTPTPTPSPSPTPTPAWDDNYLVGWTDNRIKTNVIGAYVGLNLNSTANVNKWLDIADTTELNAVVIDVKADTGKVTYQMDNQKIRDLGICITQYSNMKSLLKTLKEHGIYTIARVVCFKDNAVADVHPEYLLYNKDGSLYKDNKGDTWMNPYNRDTWEYIIDISEQAALDGFDEICFDYIRVATNGIIAKTLEDGSFEYKVEFGEEAEEKSLQQIITEFTKYSCNRLKPLGVFVSASVYGAVVRSSIDAARVGQDYTEMSRYLDYICPMTYPSHYAKGYGGIDVPDADPYKLIDIEMRGSVKKLDVLKAQQDTYAECRPWLQAFTATWVRGHIDYTGPVVRKQVDATYDNGYTSWFLWNSGAKYPSGSFLPEE